MYKTPFKSLVIAPAYTLGSTSVRTNGNREILKQCKAAVNAKEDPRPIIEVAIEDASQGECPLIVTVERAYIYSDALFILTDSGGVFHYIDYQDSNRILFEQGRPVEYTGSWMSENLVTHVSININKPNQFLTKRLEAMQQKENEKYMMIKPKYKPQESDYLWVLDRFKTYIKNKFTEKGLTVSEIEMLDFSRSDPKEITLDKLSSWGCRVMTDDSSIYDYLNKNKQCYFGFMRRV